MKHVKAILQVYNYKAANLNRLFHLKNFLRLILVLSLHAVVSCMPSEESLTQAIIDGDTTFGGFTGAATVQTLSDSSVRITWTQSSSTRVTGYRIYDTTLPSFPEIKREVGNVSSTIISGLNRNRVYQFRVKAVDDRDMEDINENDLPGIAYGGATNALVVSSTEAILNFSPATSGEATAVSVYCKTAAATEFSLVSTLTDITLTSVPITSLVTNTVYNCRVAVSVDGIEDNNNQIVTFTALGRAESLVFATQPGNAQAGQILTQQPVVRVLDENGNIVSGGPDATALITLEIAPTSPSSGSVGGTFAINAVAGVATFTGINFEESGLKIISARKADTSGLPFGSPEMVVDSSQFNITPGNVSPTLSTLTINPAIIPPFEALIANGSDSYQVIFTLRDSFGNPVSGIRPQFSSNIVGDSITQPSLNTDATGVTTGSISTSIADTTPARVLSITSPSGLNAIQVLAPFKAGPPARLAFLAQPQTSPAGLASMNPIQLAVQDAQGNLITTGAQASSSIALTISNNVNGAILTGTNPVVAVNGIAQFNDLGIDRTGTNYRLVANSGVLTPATSNNFNITAGIPRVITVSGPSEVRSGQCSDQILIQLRDLGGNLANATGNTTVQISGHGTSSFYSSNTCGGAPLSTNVLFSTGQNTKILYLKNNKSLALNIAVSDSSSVLTAANYALNITPSKIRLLAEAAIPAAPGTLLTVLSGQCSTRIVISPLAEDDTQGQVFGTINIAMSGILGSSATLFSDDTCTTAITATSFPMSLGAAPNSNTFVYLRDPVGENLMVNAADPNGLITTVSLPQEIKVLASRINYTGPSSVVAGQCSTAFTVSLRDTLNNVVPAHQNLNLTINGVQGVSTTGRFYTSSSCTGGGSNTTITMPNGSGSTPVYFRGNQAEILNIFISNVALGMTQSSTRTLTISPSAFRITPPVLPVSSLTSQCRGPFVLETLDGVGTVAPVVATTQANLSGAGISGAFYSDNNCTAIITSTTFISGQSSRQFYFKGQFPETSLTLTATHSAGVLTAATQAWAVLGDLGWVGTASTQTDSNGNLLPFRMGVKPVAARYDGIRGANHIAFSPNKQFLFVADHDANRVIKYDYQSLEYRGWIGRMRRENGIGPSGSAQSIPSSALCVGTGNDQPLPGWCVGGLSINGTESTGGFSNPWGITADDTYIYVSSSNTNSVSRHRIDTGEFEGWIGLIGTTAPSGSATGGPGSCNTSTSTVSPGWCRGGSLDTGNSRIGDGRMINPNGVKVDSVFMYVGVSGAVLRYNKATGAFQGWLGIVNVTPTGGAVGCTSTPQGQRTPGWCFGGEFLYSNAQSQSGVQGGVREARDMVISGTNLYVLNSGDGGVINRYNIDTGAFIQRLANLSFNWNNPIAMDFDGSFFYVADDERILKVGATGLIESWMGKVANPSGMSGNAGCNSLASNQNTPGWCLGGTYKPGLDETSFLDNWGLALDGSGSFVTISRRFPMLKKFSVSTGNYQGSIGLESISPRSWSSDRQARVEFHGFDDYSTYNPMGSLIVGDFLFMAEVDGSRVKKFNKRTGELIGWIGAMTSTATGGQNPASCLAANAMGPSPSWCLGASNYPSFTWGDQNLIASNVNGIMQRPHGLTTDGTWLYVTDFSLHRIQRFNLDTGAYGGWIGRIGNSVANIPTGGDPGCTAAGVNSFTPGWCLGGLSREGNGDGQMYQPTAIVFHGGNLYVVDTRNHRVSSYNAATGNFNGWIGRVGSAPNPGCTTASNGNYVVSVAGWCLGGSASLASYRNDRGGGFNFDWGNYDRGGIATDGSHLYITNTRNIRIDKYTFGGVLVESTSTRQDMYVNTWQSAAANIANIGNGLDCSMPVSVWVDSNFIYGMNANTCGSGNGAAIWKMDKTTGTIVGWKGGIQASFPTSGGDPGCAGSSDLTPGWCQGGRVSSGSTLGKFNDSLGMMFGDDHFLYVTDKNGNRMTRFPK